MVHILTETQRPLWCCPGLAALVLALGRKERQGQGRKLGPGAWRQEAGLGRARLALAEIRFSLRMMRPTQGCSGGAQSWRPLSVVNLEAERREPWSPASWGALCEGQKLWTMSGNLF